MTRLRTVAGVLAAFGLLVMAEGCSPPHGDLRGGGQEIAFTSRRDGWWSIYAIHPDGAGLRKITDIATVKHGPRHGYFDVIGQPAWSPHGDRVAFLCGAGTVAICAVDADGANRQLLVRGVQDEAPAWSPDGRDIAFFRYDRAANSDIYVMHADGTAVRRLTSGPLQNADPDWFPDGTRILFVRGQGLRYDLWSMRRDGSQMVRLTRTAAAEGNPAWSPDGRRIAFIVGEPHQDIWVMDADGSHRRDLTLSRAADEWPTWSPDGRRIAYMCGVRICVMNANGSNQHAITDGRSLDMQPAWRPG